MAKEECERCLKLMDLSKEKYVLIGTYHKKQKFKKERYYHWTCWQTFFKSRVVKAQVKSINKGVGLLKKFGIDLGNETKIELPKM